jgi:hypothetical protein
MYSYPHMCNCDHIEIGHADTEHELCPLCRMINQRDELMHMNRSLRIAVTSAAGVIEAMEDERRDLLIRIEGYRNAN